MSLPPACRAKRNIIADECAELEDLLVQSYTVPFNFKILKSLILRFLLHQFKVLIMKIYSLAEECKSFNLFYSRRKKKRNERQGP